MAYHQGSVFFNVYHVLVWCYWTISFGSLLIEGFQTNNFFINSNGLGPVGDPHWDLMCSRHCYATDENLPSVCQHGCKDFVWRVLAHFSGMEAEAGPVREQLTGCYGACVEAYREMHYTETCKKGCGTAYELWRGLKMLHKRQEEMHGSQQENYGNPSPLSVVSQESHQEVSFNVKGSMTKNDKSESVNQDHLKMESGRSSTDISFNVQSVVENTSVSQDYPSKSSSEKLGVQHNKQMKVQQIKFDFQGQVNENMAYTNVMNKKNDSTTLEENSSASVRQMDIEKQRKTSLTQIDEDHLENQDTDISVTDENEPQKQEKEIFLLKYNNNQYKQEKKDNVDTLHHHNQEKRSNVVHENSLDKHSLEEPEAPSNYYISSREEDKMLDSFLESKFKYAPNTEVQNVEGKLDMSSANYQCTVENDDCAASINAEVSEKKLVGGIDTGDKEASKMEE